MSAEPSRIANTEDWSAWENQVVNGLFPLRRFLGGSEHSGVFLTEYRAHNLADAAIKFVPADRQRAVTQLSQWRAAAALSHPHLLRLFDVGGFQFGGRAFLFVVMEYAEQTLAQVLPKRALVAEEVLGLLPPTLDALRFLHAYHMVHGQLKPSNVLVVNDQVKLASDTIRPIGQTASGVVGSFLYDPPESGDGTVSTAGDIWALGITMVEALTQHPPTWSDGAHQSVALPADVPAPLADAVHRCLSVIPENRPTAVDLEALYKPAPPAHEPAAQQAAEQEAPTQPVTEPVTASVQQPAEHHSAALQQTAEEQDASVQSTAQPPDVPAQPAALQPETWVPQAPQHHDVSVTQAPAPAATPEHESTPEATTRSIKPTLLFPVVAGAVLIFIIAWVASRSPAPRPSTAPTPAVATAPEPVAPPTAATPAAPSAIPTSNPGVQAPGTAIASTAVLHEVTPAIPPRILSKVRGHIKVTVRVLVDPSGSVVGDLLERSGPSQYFARHAREAAADWKFAPVEDQGSRVWLVHFDFSRGGVTARATAAK